MSGPPETTDEESTGVDAVTLEVIRNACTAISEEMNANLIRTGYSPNIKERRDCSCAIFDADGDMISQAENMPVHLGAMPFSVAAALERYPPETLSPGDAIMVNDPFQGGAHLPDLTLVTPVFAEADDGETIIAFAANRAHHADVGGSTAGSVAADSTEIYQEGVRIPPVKLFEGGDVVEDVMDLILANVRTPEERRGDLRAQQAANETARERLRDLADKYGIERLGDAISEIQDYSERRMQTEIAQLPDGTYEFADVLDDDGQGNDTIPIEAAVTIDGDEILVDFDGTAAQTAGAVNAVFAVTASATYYAVRCVTDPDIPPNEGAYRPIEIEAPEGTVVNASPPAAVVGGNLEVSQRVTDVILGALADVVPDRAIAACQGTMNNITFGGVDPRDDTPYAFYETQGGGFGGRSSGDGMDGVHVHMSNTMNTPAEVLQTAYPLSVERYEYRPDSGGAGHHRGGLGLRRDIRVRDHEATFSLLADRRTHPPYGINGGSDGTVGDDKLIRDGDERDIDPKSTHTLSSDDVVSIRTPGGGGFGDPADRDLDAIRRDLELGKLSAERAQAQYGYDHRESESDDA
ncbi:hydantoinase B/oxoprolinase family protein [Salinadaptatus halalkaliphilus]|uniref:Hydantoinase B/oxoprolinase family protein n=1 Tax=Salinadaptatus halalkaliphilus TaxID=2419781 RepID=A0A4S3TJ48_9EURY|nr:hydantoinase B/oxoprolinase family protein [Salinadaptatus halalkaliphilus]THE63243.1 hydantoinase B/oxoprolinase family protein [Salinadaptatus halalkaliphilus]